VDDDDEEKIDLALHAYGDMMIPTRDDCMVGHLMELHLLFTAFFARDSVGLVHQIGLYPPYTDTGEDFSFV